MIAFFMTILLATANALNITTAINTHNKYRKMHQVGNVTWDTKVASKAQNWVNNCVFGHDQNTNYGENIYASWGATKGDFIKNAIDLWYKEVSSYDFSHPGFSGRTGHFSQVVWRGTKKIGCGVKKCNDGMIIISCQYSPPGNYIGQFKENVFPLIKNTVT
jgi:uncharacterized protein YkwD